MTRAFDPFAPKTQAMPTIDAGQVEEEPQGTVGALKLKTRAEGAAPDGSAANSQPEPDVADKDGEPAWDASDEDVDEEAQLDATVAMPVPPRSAKTSSSADARRARLVRQRGLMPTFPLRKPRSWRLSARPRERSTSRRAHRRPVEPQPMKVRMRMQTRTMPRLQMTSSRRRDEDDGYFEDYEDGYGDEGEYVDDYNQYDDLAGYADLEASRPMAIVDSGEPLNDLDRTGHAYAQSRPDGVFFDVTENPQGVETWQAQVPAASG